MLKLAPMCIVNLIRARQPQRSRSHIPYRSLRELRPRNEGSGIPRLAERDSCLLKLSPTAETEVRSVQRSGACGGDPSDAVVR